MEVTISSDCVCQVFNEDLQEYVSSDECFGYCFEDSVFDFHDNILSVWLKEKGLTEEDSLLIEGSGMGWTRSSGWTQVKASEAEKALFINGEFRIEITLTPEYELYAVRYSHDEPTGTGRFVFSPAPDDLD